MIKTVFLEKVIFMIERSNNSWFLCLNYNIYYQFMIDPIFDQIGKVFLYYLLVRYIKNLLGYIWISVTKFFPPGDSYCTSLENPLPSWPKGNNAGDWPSSCNRIKKTKNLFSEDTDFYLYIDENILETYIGYRNQLVVICCLICSWSLRCIWHFNISADWFIYWWGKSHLPKPKKALLWKLLSVPFFLKHNIVIKLYCGWLVQLDNLFDCWQTQMFTDRSKSQRNRSSMNFQDTVVIAQYIDMIYQEKYFYSIFIFDKDIMFD